MDVSAYLNLHIAPRAVFDHLEERRTRPRFMVPTRTPEGDRDWEAVTWEAFARQIRRAGLFLMDLGVKPGDRVILFAHNSVEWISAALAIEAIGAVMVPIYPSSTADQAAYIIEHSDARALFVDGDGPLRALLEAWPACTDLLRVVLLNDALQPAALLKDLQNGKDPQGGQKPDGLPSFGELETRFTTFSRAQELGRSLDEERPDAFDRAMDAVSLDQPAVMLYTSGTTGRPKGVPLTHRNIGVNGRDWLQCNAPLIRESAVDVLWLPLSHIFGFGEACLGNTLGFTTYMADPLTVLKLLPEVRPSVFMSVPRYFEKLAEAAIDKAGPRATREQQVRALKDVTGGELTFALSGGAGLTREVKDFFYEAGLLVIEGYGLTEASPTLTLNRPDSFRFDSVGKPLPSVELKLAADGEILARGESIFGGYHKNPKATAETFTDDGWLKTGDLGRFTDDGFLQIVGRKKEILVTAAGKNIAPVPIEDRFVEDPYIAQLLVYGDSKKYLVAAVWINPETIAEKLGDDAGPRAIRSLVQPRIDAVNATLPSYETIKAFVLIDEPLTVENGFLTPTLKVKRQKVYDAFRDHLEALYQ